MQILIAEDDPVSRHLLCATLEKWGYKVVVARDGDQAWGILQSEESPHLAIVDWMMPGLDGPELCRRVRECLSEERSYTYMILLTARGQKEDIVEGMNAGADDYITKPFDAGELRVRLKAARRILELESRLMAAHDALRHEAMHDQLTGLWNRPAIMGMIERELARAKREGGVVSVALADLDYFKRINDTYGHDAGDRVLCDVARLLQTNLRPYDAIGRYGGEEFLIVMPACELEDAARRADQLRQRLEKTDIFLPGKTVHMTACIGVASGGVGEEDTIDAVVHAADTAMYRAKRAGRNRVEISGEAA